VRLILDGTVVRVPLDRKAAAISLLVVIGVCADGQKMLIAIKSMGGESTEAWRVVLDDLIQRGLKRPEFLSSMAHRGSKTRSPPCGTACRSSAVTVHKHRKLLAHAPERCARRSPPLEVDEQLVFRHTGRSPGAAPRRILST
jgi:transposase-like protein